MKTETRILILLKAAELMPNLDSPFSCHAIDKAYHDYFRTPNSGVSEYHEVDELKLEYCHFFGLIDSSDIFFENATLSKSDRRKIRTERLREYADYPSKQEVA
jgi:hypothetical protein